MSKTPLEAAHGLKEVIVEHRATTENHRQLAEPIVDALIESGLCRMALPAENGGLETSPLEALSVYEILAGAEASVAWVVWNNSLPCLLSRHLEPEVRSEIFADPNWLYAVSTRPTGKAAVDGDSYSVSGRWSVVSGCMHAQWIPVMCLVEEDGQVQMVAPGIPNMRMFFVPRESFEILDTWHVGGLRGTGSHDVVLADEAVVHDRSVSFIDPSLLDLPLGRVPTALTMSAGCAAISLGIAQATADTLIELGRNKVSPDPTPDLRDRGSNQATVARTVTTLNAMRRQLHEAYGRVWDSALASESPQMENLADSWAANVTTALESRAAVSAMYAAAGTSSLYASGPIERAHRDIHAVLQHVVLQPLWLEEAGRVKLGLEPNSPLFTI